MSRKGFDQVAANLRQHWYDDGLDFAGDKWEDRPALAKLAYLADFAGALDVSFERFAEAARGVLGMEPGQEFTPDHEWFIAHEFQQVQQRYGRSCAEQQRPAELRNQPQGKSRERKPGMDLER